jgi:uncharacterized protein
MKSFQVSIHKINRTFYFLAVLYFVWIAAWLLKLFLDEKFLWISSDEGSFAFWLCAKLLVWILPSLIFIHILGINFRNVLGLRNLSKALVWGGGIGILIGGLNVFGKVFIYHQPIFFDKSFLPFLSAVLIAPIVEEITFRGAVLNGFRGNYSFKTANLLTATFFLGIHLPGWYFQGNFVSHLQSPRAITVFLLGLIFGYIAYKSNSIVGAILAHSLNNLTS